MMLWFTEVIQLQLKLVVFNAGDNPTKYDPEKAGVLDFGLKSILLD